MASGGNEPPDIGGEVFYKCHPNKKVTAVVCIICEGVYHRSDFNKLKNTTAIGDTFVICPDHTDLDLTSKTSDVELNDSTKFIIAQIKLRQRESIREEYLNDIINKTNNVDLNVTSEQSELEKLKIENNLLKQLVTEMKEKNQLLNSALNKKQEDVPNNILSYSQVARKEFDKEVTKPKRIPKLIIKKKNTDDRNNLTYLVTHYLNKKKSVQTKKIIVKNDNEVLIDCMNENSAIDAEKILKEKLSAVCEIKKEEIKKPRLKVVGVDNFEKMNLKDLEADINERNFKDLKTSCTAIHHFENKRTKQISIIIEVSSEIYKRIKDNKNRVFIGYQNCRVYDDINIRPCYNCGRFGHSGHKCLNDKVCLKCAGSHNSINCVKTTEVKCVNCIFHNNRYKTNYNIQHVANDSQSCQVLKNKIRKYVESTDYPVSPTITRYIGNVDISSNKTQPTTKHGSVLSLLSSPSASQHNSRR